MNTIKGKQLAELIVSPVNIIIKSGRARTRFDSEIVDVEYKQEQRKKKIIMSDTKLDIDKASAMIPIAPGIKMCQNLLIHVELQLSH